LLAPERIGRLMRERLFAIREAGGASPAG
jgi:hypothetical protein